MTSGRSARNSFLSLVLLSACGSTVPAPEIPPIDPLTQQSECESPPCNEGGGGTLVEPARDNRARESLGLAQLVSVPSDEAPIVHIAFFAGHEEDRNGQRAWNRPLRMNELTMLLMSQAAQRPDFHPNVFISPELSVFAFQLQEGGNEDAFIADIVRTLRPGSIETANVELGALGARGLSENLRLLLASPFDETGGEARRVNISGEQLLEHAQQTFCSGRSIIGVAGGEGNSLARRIRDALRESDHGSCQGHLEPQRPETRGRISRAAILPSGLTQVTSISAGQHIEVSRDHPDYVAMMVFAAHLGTSRQAGVLTEALQTQRGLAAQAFAEGEFEQSVAAEFGLLRMPYAATHLPQFAMHIAGVAPENVSFVAHFSAYILARELEQGLSSEAFEAAKARVLASLAERTSSASYRLANAVEDRFYDTIDPFEDTVRAGLEALDANAVIEAARRHLAPRALQFALRHPDPSALAQTLTDGSIPDLPVYSDERSPEEIAARNEEDSAARAFPLRFEGRVQILSE